MKWEPLGGKNNEFLVYFPQGYRAVSDGNFYKGGVIGEGAHVEKRTIIYRYINGVVLLMEYYEGDSKKLQKITEKMEKLLRVKEEKLGSLTITHFSQEVGKGNFEVIQHFLIKDRLYVLKCSKKPEQSPLAKGFLESVRYISKDQTFAPNSPDIDPTTLSLPVVSEVEGARNDDAAAIDSNDADRKPIILFTPRPKFSTGFRNGRLRLKVLYSSSGKVTNVEVLEAPSKLMEKEAIQAARQSVFIPAEKDGILVSVYQTVNYSVEQTTRIIGF